MRHYLDEVLFALFSFGMVGMLMKFLYSTWLCNLYIKQIEAIVYGTVLLGLI